MTLTASGSANESGNVTNVCLAEDTGTIGQYDGESVVSDEQSFDADNGAVTLTTSPQIQFSAGGFKRVLVIADNSANVDAGENVTISLNNPSTDYVATGFHSGTRVQDSSTTAISNTTWATGNVTAAEGTNTTAIGPITAMNDTLVEIMQLNFSAPRGAVNITNITLKENGTATISGTNGIKNVSVWFDGTCYNNTQAALWTENGTLLLNLSHPTTDLGLIVNGTTQEVTIKVKIFSFCSCIYAKIREMYGFSCKGALKAGATVKELRDV